MIRILKQLFRSFFKSQGNQWIGDYPNWQSALQASKGYNAPEILEKIKAAALRVKSGEYACERDSVLFREKQYDWSLVAFLLKAAWENHGQLTVLDFGGSLGSSYYSVRNILEPLTSLKWCIVEQENFVACGKSYFEDDNLLFYDTIESCLAEHQPQVFLLSSVLQYLEKPFELISQINQLSLDYLFVLRTGINDKPKDRLCVQIVDPQIYQGSYPTWIFSEEKLLARFSSWFLEAACESPFAPRFDSVTANFRSKNYFFRKRDS